ERRLVPNVIAVPVGHVLHDLIVALPFCNELAQLAAQIDRERCVGIEDRLAPTLQAAKLAPESLVARLKCGIFERRARVDRLSGLHTEHEHQCKSEEHTSELPSR